MAEVKESSSVIRPKKNDPDTRMIEWAVFEKDGKTGFFHVYKAGGVEFT